MAHRSAPVVVTRRAGSGRGDPGRRGIDSSARLAIVLCCVVLLQMSFFGRMQLRSMRAVRDDQKIAGWDRVVSPRSLARIPCFPLSLSLSLVSSEPPSRPGAREGVRDVPLNPRPLAFISSAFVPSCPPDSELHASQNIRS